MPLNRSAKRRSWSAALISLGAFLSGLLVAAILIVALLLQTVERKSTEVVFEVPAAPPPAPSPAPPGEAPAAGPVAAPPAAEPQPPAPEKPAADHAPAAAAPAIAEAPPAHETPSAIPPHPVPQPTVAEAANPSSANPSSANPSPAHPSPGNPSPGNPPSANPPSGGSVAIGGGGGGGALAPAPDPQLIERTPDGVLPIVGADGRLPWQVYARPFSDPQRRPRVAILVNGLGLSDLSTQSAIEHLPLEVSLGFSPYAKRLGDWIQLARTVGHEVLIDVPLEPDDPENQDPGPDTLLSTQPPAQNIARLHAIMGRVTGYVGLVPSRSDRFANVPAALRPVLDDLRARGLLVLDTSSTTLAAAPPSLVRIGADLIIDAEPSPAAIDRRLADLEAAAKRNGVSAGIGRPLPVTLTEITNWAAGLEKRGLVLAPLTAIVRR